MRHPRRVLPGPGQESVWDYPRPPRLEPVSKTICVLFGGEVIADTNGAMRVLETSHPPVYYLPPRDIRTEVLVDVGPGSSCEWKGSARYFDVIAGGRRAARAAWSYPTPTDAFSPMRDFIAFYAAEMDSCTVDGEEVEPQPGGFYGGWITSDIVGPFKGGEGTMGW